MRLTCPNCGTECDVADEPIPENGQDVQSSNCNHTWLEFQKKSAPANTADASATDTQSGRKPLYPTFSNILSDEAVRENQMRASASTAMRLTHEDTISRRALDAKQTRRRIAEMTEARAERKKLAKAFRVATAHRAAKRPKLTPAQHRHRVPQPSEDTDTNLRDMPSINDINTSVRTHTKVPQPELTNTEQAEVMIRHSFRRGFVIILLILSVFFGPYVFANQITAKIPQTTDPMASYVSMVDGWRITLNRRVDALAAMIADVIPGPGEQPDQN